ncbi:MAG: ATP-dependent helicase [Methanomassiliicoccales archaeon]
MERITERSTKEEVMDLLEPLVAEWFQEKFDSLTEPQSYAIPLIHQRRSVLVSSPTGSGKTLTAFLSIINELFKYAKEGRLEDRIYAVYVSPLKALANDINRNLEEPLREMRELAERKGVEFPDIRVGVRSGDTSPYERQKQLRKPPHIFITTPESLSLVLAAPKFRERFSRVEWAITDEIHEICDSKRGVHLSLTLERLQDLVQDTFTRVGLSATLAPMERIAAFLSGYQGGEQRDICLVEAETRKALDMSVISPAEDMTALPFEIVSSRMYDTLKEMVDRHTTTLVFTNTRSGTESVVFKLKERGLEDVEAHHGSLSKETRLDVEERLKHGRLKCAVSSTSLELGIDIGSIDLVCQIGSPKSVAKGLQRIGRSGHAYGQTAKGRMLVMDNDDLVECAVLSRAAHQGRVDRVTIPENCLDVLAQTLVGMSVERRWEVEEAFRLVRRSYCYRELPRESFMQVLRYLGSRGEYEGIYPKMWLDEEEGRFGRKKGSRMIYSMNIGTIPEEAHYKVFTERGSMVGDLSEKFAERLSPGDVFVLGGKSYQFMRIKGMKAFVREAQGKKPTVPSWTGEMLPRSFDLSMEVARFRRELAGRLEEDQEEVLRWLETFNIDRGSARSILSYFQEQERAALVPHDRRLAVEGYVDPGGRHNVIFHYPFGRRVNDALSRAYAHRITKEFGCNTSVSVTDDAFMITAPRRVDLEAVKHLVDPSSLEGMLRRAIKGSELFKQRFRHVASRSFMVLRAYKGKQVSVNRQQVRSSYLLDSLRGMRNFPVIEETYREVLRDVMDLENAQVVLGRIERSEAEVEVIDYSETPSPFAHNVVLTGISDLVLMEDRSALLRELHRKVLSRVMADDLDSFELDEDATERYFRSRRGRVEGKEDILDLLGKVGPLRIFKDRGRSIYPYCDADREEVDRWAEELLAEGRIASVHIDDPYFVAAEDLPMYATVLRRDRELDDTDREVLERADGSTARAIARATGHSPDRVRASLRKLESSFLVGRAARREGEWLFRRGEVPTTDRQRALDGAVLRHLEAYGPSSADEVAFAFSADRGEVERALRDLVREGRLAQGRFLVSEQEQFMLQRDYLRLKHGAQAYDHHAVDAYRRGKQDGPFPSIRECLAFFGEMGLPFDLFRRVQGFDMGEWERMRRSGEVLQGRFLRGKVRYVLAEDAPLFVAAYRRDELTPRDREVLGYLERYQGLSMRELVSLTGYAREQIKDSLGRLDRNMHVVRGFQGREGWASENVYHEFDCPPYQGDPVRDLVRRFVRAHGPVPVEAIRRYTRFPSREIREAVRDLETIVVGEERTEMYLFPEELQGLEAGGERGEVTVRSLYDPVVQPHWAEVSARYGDRWIFPLLQGSELVGAVEKWSMSGFVEVRELDLLDNSLLPQALGALDHLLEYHSMNGLDVLRVTEVMGTPVPELPPDILDLFRERGYHRVGDLLVAGNAVPRSFPEEELMDLVMIRQRLRSGDHFENILDGVKGTGGFRSDAEAFARCRVRVPLEKMREQRLVEKVNAVPGYMTYTDMEWASLFNRAKGHELTEDMWSLLRIVRERSSLFEEQLYDLSPVGRRRTYEALRALRKGTYLYKDHRRRVRAVPESALDQGEAMDRVILSLFERFGTFTAENLQRFTLNEFPMRDLRATLARLEREGVLVKGFLLQGNGSLHWILSEDLDRVGEDFLEEFVLTNEDNLYHYLKPWIKERFDRSPCLIMGGSRVLGTFRCRKRGKSIVLTEFSGGREAKRVLNAHIRRMGLTVRGERTDPIPEWEIQEFYEKTHYAGE